MTWSFHAGLIFPKGRLSFVEHWPLMDPSRIVFVLASYLLFVLKIGPILMEGRRPVQIKGFLVFYNLIKVIHSAVLTYKFFTYIVEKGLFPRKCEYDERTLHQIAAYYWLYMITKSFDLVDTIFFVVRKKYSQITFLHIYHHTFMVLITWTSLKYDPSDHWAFMAVMNCLVHTIMYTYYGIAALGPQFAKYIWWKKYLTMLQLIQFVLIIVHVVIQTYTTKCPMHTSTYWVGLSNLGLFICLFAEFYYKRYVAKSTVPIGLTCTKQVTE